MLNLIQPQKSLYNQQKVRLLGDIRRTSGSNIQHRILTLHQLFIHGFGRPIDKRVVTRVGRRRAAVQIG